MLRIRYWPFLGLLVACICSGALADVTTKTYNVEGSSLSEVLDSIGQNGFTEPDGSVHAGEAKSTLVASEANRQESAVEVQMPCPPDNIGYECTVTADIAWSIDTVITLPTWPGASEVCEEARAEWTRFLDKLTQHEQGHVQIVEKALADANPKVRFTGTAIGCDREQCLMDARTAVQGQIDQELNRVQALINAANEKYDDDTDHGATQDAVLDTSIICPDPKGDLTDIKDELDFLDLEKGLLNSLTVKLNNAIKSIEKGKKKAAIGQIGAFINEVKAKSPKPIAQDVADDFIERAMMVQEQLKK